MHLVFTDQALTSLESLRAYISRDNRKAATEQVERIFSHISSLSAHPLSGRPGRIQGTRELAISGTKYIAAYTVNDNAVQILAIIHGARQWPEKM
ncbi:type II toxin-antitoxin system RelE/ParE family toxin [bacterium]|nr:type II toxin-antitoxin system RelE/ParE family toxin [bacterium]